MAADRQTSDVLVVGGGIIGLSVAWRLAQRGMSVALLERDRIGGSASWAAAGVLAAGAWQRRDAAVEFQRKSLRLYPRFCAEVAEASGIDPEYANCGSIELLFEEQKLRMALVETDAAEAYLDFENKPVLRLLTPADARQIEPKVTANCLGAKLCSFTSQVRNPRLLRALAIAARAAGARIIEGCEASALRRDGERIVGVHTRQGDFSAKTTVLCAGAWSSQVDPQIETSMPVHPVRGQIVLLHMQPSSLQCIIRHRKAYVVPRLDGHILIGSTVEPDAGYDVNCTAEGIAILLDQARRMVPPLASARFVQTWAGLRPGTVDRRPYIGPVPGCDGLIAATGHYRTGLGLAPLTAEVVADLVIHGRSAYDLRPFQPGRAPVVQRSPQADRPCPPAH